MSHRILVTGATGFIGSWLTEALLNEGHEVFALTRRVSNKANLDTPLASALQYREADYDSVRSLESAVKGMTHIYHVAGVTKALNEAGYHKGNVEATENLLKAVSTAAPSLTRFVHISSGAAVGPSSDPNHPIDETAPCKPVTLYGKSKRGAEIVCERWMKDLPITILRPSIIYGPRDKDLLEHFKTVKAGFMPIFGVGVEKRYDYLFVKNLVKGMIDGGFSSNTVGETYFLSGPSHSWKEVGDAAKEALGKRFAVPLYLPDSVSYAVAAVVEDINKWQGKISILNRDRALDGAQRYWIFSTSKAARDFGFKADTSLKEGFISTVSWYRQKGWL